MLFIYWIIYQIARKLIDFNIFSEFSFINLKHFEKSACRLSIPDRIIKYIILETLIELLLLFIQLVH